MELQEKEDKIQIKESIDEKFLKPVDLNLFKLQVKENHFAGKDIRSQLWKEKS